MWDTVIDSLSNLEGSIVSTDPNRWDLETPGYTEIFKLWKQANYNANSIQWINYYPDIHYSKDIVTKLAEELNLSHVHRSWISRINPGYTAPWHWDVDDNESEYLSHGHITRYTVMMHDFSMGHIFILNDDYHIKCKKGDQVFWDDHRSWHAGINAGLEPNYMFHILGVSRAS